MANFELMANSGWRIPRPGILLLVLISSRWLDSLSCAKKAHSRFTEDTSALTSNPNPSAVAQDCTASVETVQISEKCIGDLAIDSSIGYNARLHGAQFDTTVYGHESEESSPPYPSVGFAFPGLRAVALQYGESLRNDLPADAWIIVGSKGELPRKVPLTATWGDLKRAYGSAVGNAEYDVTITFCSYPAFRFYLTADPAKTGSIEVTGDLSSIPDTSQIAHVLILPARIASRTGCRNP